MAMTTSSFDTLQVYIVVATIAMNPCLGYISISFALILTLLLMRFWTNFWTLFNADAHLAPGTNPEQQQMHSKHKHSARF
jgi:hypothetical protein